MPQLNKGGKDNMGRMITDPKEAATTLQGIFANASKAVFFGGAGVSTASGIPDFRSPTGLYHQKFSSEYSPEELLSHHLWQENPEVFYDFYRHMMCAPNVKPNQAHLKLAELEKEGHLAAVVTQNIDGLHQAAGSQAVWELHGSTHRNVCLDCGAIYSQDWVLGTEGIPWCEDCGGIVKPDVVLYEEPLDDRQVSGALTAISEADLLVIGGTSLVVWPAAGLIDSYRGDTLVICNLQPTPQDAKADIVCACDIAKAFDF